jgi:HD-like signal output (HDOD) protein/CheY-like chemotaxis protein
MGSPNILLIDDDSAIRGALQRSLPEHGFDICAVPSARAAVAELTRRSFDLLLVDMQMPDISGDIFVRELAKRGSTIPVIVVSGTKSVPDVIKMMRLGVQDFVHKPFATGELIAAIQRALSAGAASRTPVPEVTVPQRAPRSGSDVPCMASAPHGVTPRTPGLPNILAKLEGGGLKLPVLDPRVADIQNFISAPEAGIDDILRAMGRDPTLTASVLQVANSGYYNAGARPFENLRDASVRIGNRQVLTVAMQVLIRNAFTCRLEPFRTMMSRAWENLHLTARITARLAERCGEANPEDLYVAGLLHNIGELVMLQLFSELYDGSGGMTVPESKLAEALQAHHERFGKAIAESWSQPPMVRRLAGVHHTAPAGEHPAERQQRDIVLTAWAMACELTPDYIAAEGAPNPAECAAALPLTAAEFIEFHSEISRLRPSGADA